MYNWFIKPYLAFGGKVMENKGFYIFSMLDKMKDSFLHSKLNTSDFFPKLELELYLGKLVWNII